MESGFLGKESLLALTVTVKVVFPLLRKELDGPLKTCSSDHGPDDLTVIEFSVKKVGLSPQFCGGVGIGVGDEDVVINGGEKPVHGRIR